MSMTRAGREELDRYRQLDLDDKQPWGGRSPRALTKAFRRFSLRQEALPLDELGDEELDEQYRRFLSDG